MYLKSHFCTERCGDGIGGETADYIYMQVRLIRLASEQWHKSIEGIAELFARYNVLQYSEECFGIFHVEGDEAVLEDIALYMKNRGAADDTETGKL